MIVKGRARSGPEQLAAYLLRVGDGERATILDRGLNGDDLHNEFLLFHTIGDAGKTDKTLYHAQICPEAKYGRKMTPEEWLRSAEMLAEDMGMAHHPRRVVLHDGGDKPHVHVVFQRCDPETLKMWELWQNYKKHELASLRMSQEFGMEIIPGKHAKRDREKQPEFPRAESTQADQQQAKRTEISFDERKAQLTAIRKPCDDAQAFRNALEEAGYILAKGDTRGFVVVDGDGEVFSLSKHLAGDIKGKAYKDFMASIDPATLPTVEQAKALHEQRQKQAPAKAEGTVQEAPQPQSPQGPEKAEQPAPAPQDVKKPAEIETPAPAPYDYELYSPIKKSSTPSQASKFLPPEAAPVQGIEQSKFVAPAAIQLPSGQLAPASEDQGPPPAGESPEVLAIRKAVAERQAEDAKQWADYDALKLRQLDTDLTVLNNGKMGDLDHLQEGALKALTAKQAERRTGVMGVIDAIQSKLNPTAAAEKKAAQEKEFIALILRQQRERKDYVALIEQTRQLQLDDMKERQGLAREMRAAGNEGEAERYVQAHLDAKRLAAELEEKEIHEKLEKEQAIREGMPPPEKGK
jgi:hypothetical protein